MFNQAVTQSRRLLENPYAHVDELNICLDFPLVNKTSKLNNTVSFNSFLNASRFDSDSSKVNKVSKTVPSLGNMQNPYAYTEHSTYNFHQYRSNKDIEQIARGMQIKLWKNLNKETRNKSINPIRLFSPLRAFDVLGYEFNEFETLDDYSNNVDFKVAGMLDKSSKKAYISTQFPLEVQRFTAAHELGHALMHESSRLHRDRAVDGLTVAIKRERKEIEADKFAVFFLMPTRLVTQCFVQAFGSENFLINDSAAFWLDPANNLNVMKNRNNIRFISRILASVESYNGRHFASLSKQFGVSVEAMAIRLEELKLINI